MLNEIEALTTEECERAEIVAGLIDEIRDLGLMSTLTYADAPLVAKALRHAARGLNAEAKCMHCGGVIKNPTCAQCWVDGKDENG